jgi:hypothetical protein
MTPGAILDTLKAHGVRLTRDGEDLIATPKAALTDELRALIREHKPELLEAVGKVEPTPGDREFFRGILPGAVISRKPAPASGLESIAAQFADGRKRVMWFDQDMGFVMVAWTENGVPQAPVLLTIPPDQCDWSAILERFIAAANETN